MVNCMSEHFEALALNWDERISRWASLQKAVSRLRLVSAQGSSRATFQLSGSSARSYLAEDYRRLARDSSISLELGPAVDNERLSGEDTAITFGVLWPFAVVCFSVRIAACQAR